MNKLTPAQVDQLLAPIRPVRVLADPRGNSHVSQQDVTAHLTRVFGFGNFNTEIVTLDLVYDQERVSEQGIPNGRWDACYRCRFRLIIKNPDGSFLATYEDASCGDASNQKTRADAHDLAMKSAISTAKKRCAINLGDQFGLSLYNKGQLTALVRGTLVRPGYDTAGDDVQEGVEQQVSLGVDETEKNTEPTEEQAENLAKALGATVIEDVPLPEDGPIKVDPSNTEIAIERARKAAAKK